MRMHASGWLRVSWPASVVLVSHVEKTEEEEMRKRIICVSSVGVGVVVNRGQ